MKNYVENSKLLKLVIITFSVVVTLITFMPIMLDLNSNFAIIMLVIIIGIISGVITARLMITIDNYIDSCIEQKRKRHVQDFFNFIEDDKEYREIIKRNTPIKSEGKEIGSQTIASALSDMKWAYYNKIDLTK